VVKDYLGRLMALNEEVDGDMLLVKDAVNVIGEQNLLTGIEQRIRNCNCRVAFGFENASEELAEEQYESLFLAEHWVEVPKAAMTDKFGGPPFQPWKRESDSPYYFKISADEAPNANGVKETIYNINNILIPDLKENLASMEINDYTIIFVISMFM